MTWVRPPVVPSNSPKGTDLDNRLQRIGRGEVALTHWTARPGQLGGGSQGAQAARTWHGVPRYLVVCPCRSDHR